MASSLTLPGSRPRGALRQVHRAGWVMVDPDDILQNGYVVIEDRIIREVGRGRVPGDALVTDHGSGVLMPPLANVHTHLELSALQGRIGSWPEFRSWVRELIRLRDEIDAASLLESARNAVRFLKASGCLLVGDISTTGLTREMFFASGLCGVWFQELLGGDPAALSVEGKGGQIDSFRIAALAGHGPHTTSPGVLAALKSRTRGDDAPFSIHAAESEDEMTFLAEGKGAWADLLTERGIDFQDWPVGSASPVRYLERLGLLDRRTILVHCIHCDGEDRDLLRKHQPSVCLCPRSNQRLHRRLPDVEALHRSGVNLCLGTDSLASVDSLDIFDEMAFLARMFPGLSPCSILRMATKNGAAALGLAAHFGTLTPGKQGAMLYLPLEAASREELAAALVGSGPTAGGRLLGTA
ncbi:MAG: amidohydrolase family protein [Thermodesulfobacteriota bacterium]